MLVVRAVGQREQERHGPRLRRGRRPFFFFVHSHRWSGVRETKECVRFREEDAGRVLWGQEGPGEGAEGSEEERRGPAEASLLLPRLGELAEGEERLEALRLKVNNILQIQHVNVTDSLKLRNSM